jgi:hypothetical protein
MWLSKSMRHLSWYSHFPSTEQDTKVSVYIDQSISVFTPLPGGPGTEQQNAFYVAIFPLKGCPCRLFGMSCPSARHHILQFALLWITEETHWRKAFRQENTKAMVHHWVQTLSIYVLYVEVNHLIFNWDKGCVNWAGGSAERWRVCL